MPGYDEQPWQPIEGRIMTRWAKEVSPENVLPEYPRPQMVREAWMNLNGLWEYAVAPRKRGAVTQYQGRILVPFPIESALSGVKKPLLPDQRLWYRRTFAVPGEWRGQKLLLHFGAVDWEASVWVNGHLAGTHRGGYDPFSFEISAHLSEEGKNELIVAVWDPTDEGTQERGKQVLEPGMIWYTAVSGIWQTVWLEPVPSTYIHGLRITPDLDGAVLRLAVRVEGEAAGVQVEARVYDGGQQISVDRTKAGDPLELSIQEPKLWSPDSPHLYDLSVTISRDGQTLDDVQSYFGMREFSLARDSDGTLRLCLNKEILFHYGPLDQGYWPDGLYTAPTDKALRYDVEVCKQLGFNMVRKHIKVEPARYYYHCDRQGLIVWQDMPNGGRPTGSALSFLTIMLGIRLPDGRLSRRRFGRQDRAARENYRRELQAMIDALYNVPCIGMWVPFNEGWGQFDANQVAQWTRTLDPTRPVDHASGWFDQGGGDFKSLHVYFKRLRPSRPERDRATILSEFGGYSLKLEGHLWNPDEEFGYKRFMASEELTRAYIALLEEELKPWIRAGLAGAVYTQISDVEIEVNGFLTYDREVIKMDPERIAAVHYSLQQPFGSVVEQGGTNL
jgi:beta-galactosidase/beta-glucuronidase